MRKLCVYTSTRAEYGLLRGLMEAIRLDENLTLQLLVSGAHLSPEFGMTVHDIQADGYEADETVEILLSGDTPVSVCKAMGLAMIGYGEALARLQPDILILLGDRFETFCMAACAQVCRIPVAHIHGGESTEGAIDESFRHSITKMSLLHFAACEEYRRRIIQLGESPDRVFNVGALGVEHIRNIQLMDKKSLSESIHLDLNRPFFLVTFHPVTLEKSTVEEQFQDVLSALDEFTDYQIIFTKANADTEGRIVNFMIDEYVSLHRQRAIAVDSLGMKRYLSAMRLCEAVIGNSSSGIIEAPAFKVPTVNIGDRQKGRVRADSVIDCGPDQASITQAIRKAVDPGFRSGLENMEHPFEQPGTARKIMKIIKNNDIKYLKKKFYDFNQINRWVPR